MATKKKEIERLDFDGLKYYDNKIKDLVQALINNINFHITAEAQQGKYIDQTGVPLVDVSATSLNLISLDDLRDVLTDQQMTALEAKVVQRQALVKAEMERRHAELLEAMEKAEKEGSRSLESAESGQIGSGEITKPSKPSVEGTESV